MIDISILVSPLHFLNLISLCLVNYVDMQAIITQINEKIGAAGVVSQECKTVVSQYGEKILDQLLPEVCTFIKHAVLKLVL